MTTPRDLLSTFASAASGEPIGDIHLQVLAHHFCPDDFANPKRLKRTLVLLRKLLQAIASDARCLRLLQSYRRRIGKKLPVDQWPEAEAVAFFIELDALLDLTDLLDDAKLFAFSFESVRDERKHNRIAKPNGTRSWYLQLTTAGTGILHWDDRDIALAPGALLLAQPGVPLFMERDPEAAMWRHCCVYFQPQPHWYRWLDWGGRSAALMQAYAPPDAMYKLETLFNDLNEIMVVSASAQRDLEINLLEQIFIRCRDLAPLEPSSMDPRVVAAQNFLLQNLQSPVRLAEVARAAGVSHSRLLALFGEHVGMGVMEWRDRQRMMMAAQMLRESKLAVAEVARAVGYSDPLYFSRVFRRHLQASPSASRE